MSRCAELAHWMKGAVTIPAQPDRWQILQSVVLEKGTGFQTQAWQFWVQPDVFCPE